MLVKRYHAKDMKQAIDMVIKELGSDAVILNSRKMRKKGFKNLFRKPILEVMVAYDPAKIPAARKFYDASDTPPPAEESKNSEKEKKVKEIGAEQVEALDKRIDALDSMLKEFIDKFSFVKRDITYDYSEKVQELFCSMIENQVRDELAHSIAKETDQMLKKRPETDTAEIMQHLIMEQLGTPDPIQHKKFTRKTVLIIGPTGVGKTTSIVKLAANFAIKQKKKVGIINTDTYRIAAQQQLQTYADILSVPLQVVYNTEDIKTALENMSDREVVFIDTAGKRPGDKQHSEDILKIIQIAEPEDVLLCIPATTSFAAAKEIVDVYSYAENYRLLITKLDETKYRGMILNLSWYTQRTLAYVTTGQNVPDDIELIDAESIANQILGLQFDSAAT